MKVTSWKQPVPRKKVVAPSIFTLPYSDRIRFAFQRNARYQCRRSQMQISVWRVTELTSRGDLDLRMTDSGLAGSAHSNSLCYLANIYAASKVRYEAWSRTKITWEHVHYIILTRTGFWWYKTKDNIHSFVAFIASGRYERSKRKIIWMYICILIVTLWICEMVL